MHIQVIFNKFKKYILSIIHNNWRDNYWWGLEHMNPRIVNFVFRRQGICTSRPHRWVTTWDVITPIIDFGSFGREFGKSGPQKDKSQPIESLIITDWKIFCESHIKDDFKNRLLNNDTYREAKFFHEFQAGWIAGYSKALGSESADIFIDGRGEYFVTKPDESGPEELRRLTIREILKRIDLDFEKVTLEDYHLDNMPYFYVSYTNFKDGWLSRFFQLITADGIKWELNKADLITEALLSEQRRQMQSKKSDNISELDRLEKNGTFRE
jgi:hypothetical protein